MERMNNPDVAVIATKPFGKIRSGFMKKSNGDIIFLGTHGRETVPYAVLVDGTISMHGDVSNLMGVDRSVDLVHPTSLGINPSEIRWTNTKVAI